MPSGRSLRALAFPAALWLAIPSVTIPQQVAHIGDRVRFRLARTGASLAGDLTDLTADTVTLARGTLGLYRFSRRDVQELEVRIASGGHGKTGALIGLAVVATLDIVGALTAKSGVGAGVGFLIGSAVRWAEWEKGSFPARPGGVGRASPGIQIGFRLRL